MVRIARVESLQHLRPNLLRDDNLTFEGDNHSERITMSAPTLLRQRYVRIAVEMDTWNVNAGPSVENNNKFHYNNMAGVREPISNNSMSQSLDNTVWRTYNYLHRH